MASISYFLGMLIMFKDDLISSIDLYWEMQGVDDLSIRLAMHRRSSHDPLVEAGIGLNIVGEPGFTPRGLAELCEKTILARLGAYLIRDRVEAGLLAYIAADRDALARLAEAAERPEEWMAAARRRVDRFNSEHPICNRPRS